MRPELLTLALIVGAFTYAFRFLPTRADLTRLGERGPLSRFLSSTGPAAISTLFTASIFPSLSGTWAANAPVFAGIIAVLATTWASRSVVLSALAGSAAYGVFIAVLT